MSNPGRSREWQIRAFWDKVDRRSLHECWPWTASVTPKGYGLLNLRGLPKHAHRVAFLIANGEIPSNAWILHKCDNPPCCNPAHLFVGDHHLNMADMVSKHRARSGVYTHPERIPRGEGVWRSKLKESDVREIRDRRAKGESAYVLAEAFGVRATAIYKIEHRKTWKHI